jgi:serine/threonine-protein kinase
MGTPYYMSPEQISGAKNVDARTDLWALGVIACECVTGRRPFEADSVGGLTLKICIEPMPRPSSMAEVPVGFDEWFARAVSRSPADRFATARELSDEHRRICTGDVSLGAAPTAVAPGRGSVPGTTGGVTAASAPSMGAMSTTARNGGTQPKRSGNAGVWVAVIALGAVLVGSAGAWLVMGSRSTEEDTATSTSAEPPAPAAADTVAPPPPVEVVPAPPPPVEPAASVAEAKGSAPALTVAPIPKPTKLVARPAPTAAKTSAVTLVKKPAAPFAAAPPPPPKKVDARSVIDSRR